MIEDVFNIIIDQKYSGLLSFSDKKGKQDTFTYAFNLQPWDIPNMQKMGFTPMVYKGGHRCKENVIGMTDIGYFDIDLGDGNPMDYKDFKVIEPTVLAICKSKSGAYGKYRVIYRRPFTIEDMAVIGNGFIMRRFESQEEMILFMEYSLSVEVDKLLSLIPKVAPHIDKTACKVHMHSSWIGECLYQASASETLTDYRKDYGDFEQYRSQNYRIFDQIKVEVMDIDDKNAIKARYQTTNEGDKIIHRAYGNAFLTSLGWMKISRILSRGVRPQMADIIKNRIETPDAFMPFVIQKYENSIILSSKGIHKRNENEYIRVVIKRGKVEKGTRIVLDGKVYLLDEINLKYERLTNE